jgi:hypothetical protein
VRPGDLVNALRVLESREARRTLTYPGMCGAVRVCSAEPRRGVGDWQTREVMNTLDGRGRRLPKKLADCPVEVKTAGGLLLVRSSAYRPQEIHHKTTEEVMRAEGLEKRLRRRQQNARRLETRGLAEGPAAGGAARCGSSTASTKPACTPRCLSCHSSRTRRGKAD